MKTLPFLLLSAGLALGFEREQKPIKVTPLVGDVKSASIEVVSQMSNHKSSLVYLPNNPTPFHDPLFERTPKIHPAVTDTATGKIYFFDAQDKVLVLEGIATKEGEDMYRVVNADSSYDVTYDVSLGKVVTLWANHESSDRKQRRFYTEYGYKTYELTDSLTPVSNIPGIYYQGCKLPDIPVPSYNVRASFDSNIDYAFKKPGLYFMVRSILIQGPDTLEVGKVLRLYDSGERKKEWASRHIGSDKIFCTEKYDGKRIYSGEHLDNFNKIVPECWR
jgi:hypothetical protein